MKLNLAQESDMVAFGGRVAQALPASGMTVALQGNLGAGKTTLVRAVLRALGITGHVRSPTYTLVEPYDLAARRVWHLDLYRVNDPEELEFLGIRDLDTTRDLIFIEWPEQGASLLPRIDLKIAIAATDDQAREVVMQANTIAGRSFLGRLESR